MSLLGRLSGPSGHTVVTGRAFRRSLPNATTGNVSRTSDTGRWAQRSMGTLKTAVKRRPRIRRPTANDCNRCSLVVRKWPKGTATHRNSSIFLILTARTRHTPNGQSQSTGAITNQCFGTGLVTAPVIKQNANLSGWRSLQRQTAYLLTIMWLRGQDLNLRPLGYEPNELPDCSTPRLSLGV